MLSCRVPNLTPYGGTPGALDTAQHHQLILKADPETLDLLGIEHGITPMQDMTMVIHRKNGQTDKVALRLRIDTPIEADYFNHDSILPYVLRELLA